MKREPETGRGSEVLLSKTTTRGREVSLTLDTSLTPQIIDYEGSRYRTDFWEGQGREYEDLIERAAIRQLLPIRGGTIMEAGAGFGRLADLYAGYERVVLVDYSVSMLREARQLWGHDARFRFVAASVYHLPFVDYLFDALVMVRVMHHLESPARALGELARVLQGGRPAVIEYANKRNVKAIIRYLLRRQSWSPFNLKPYEFVKLNYDFHPRWMSDQFLSAGLSLDTQLAVSHFRLETLKRRMSPRNLARLDEMLFWAGGKYPLSPSVFVRCLHQAPHQSAAGIFRCPACGSSEFREDSELITCQVCDSRWPISDGIYDFRYPIDRPQ